MLLLLVVVIQKSELTSAHESHVAANGPSDSAVVPDDELRRQLELKDEEVKLYRNKYEDCSKQLLQAVCRCC